MSKLQELLDDKFPLDGLLPLTKKDMLERREIFTQGYNAAKEEMTPKYTTESVLKECRRLMSEGRNIAALRLYKETMGCSLTDAKNILNL